MFLGKLTSSKRKSFVGVSELCSEGPQSGDKKRTPQSQSYRKQNFLKFYRRLNLYESDEEIDYLEF